MGETRPKEERKQGHLRQALWGSLLIRCGVMLPGSKFPQLYDGMNSVVAVCVVLGAWLIHGTSGWAFGTSQDDQSSLQK